MIRVVVVALATARLMRAWRHEQIGEPFYNAVQDWSGDPVISDNVVDMRATKAKLWVGDLASCPHCLGFWTSLAFTVAWPWTPARRLVQALAAAMLVSAIVDHYPGFDPEADETVDVVASGDD